ncbi:MAG: complex I NDUFA9 subunit family protein [Robiginitomaculum sp.]|nr:complex I NDUFA9 subunit family protein [Robiginitomaculum sp.]
MNKLAVVFGGSGFLGRQVVRELCRKGWRVRVAVRRAHQAVDLRVEGGVGQVQLVQCNIRSDASIAAAMSGAQIAINLVGVLFESGKQKFDDLHTEGAARIAQAALALGVQHLVQVSALGASEQSASKYARSKAKGEIAVLKAFPNATILRPSVLFGSGDGLFERFAGMLCLTPIVPLPMADTKLQPVFVGDVAAAIVATLQNSKAAGTTYELGGPQTLTLGQIVQNTAIWIERKRLIIGLPKIAAKTMGVVGDISGAVPFVTPFITSDQILQLEQDNIVSDNALGFTELGIKRLETIEANVPVYLGRFRKYGQFHKKVA